MKRIGGPSTPAAAAFSRCLDEHRNGAIVRPCDETILKVLFTFTCRLCGYGPYRSTACNQYFCSPSCREASYRSGVDLRAEPGPCRPDLITETGATKVMLPLGPGWRPHRIDLHTSTNTTCRIDPAWKRILRKPRAPKTHRVCKQCSAKFMPNHGGTKTKFCSSACAARYERRGKGRNAKRAKAAGAEARYFNEMRIFERDKWTCQICRVKTPKKLRGTYEPNAPEIDHILPLGAGGAHTQENCQCACRSCNGRKGAKPQGQLWLMGIADVMRCHSGRVA